MAKTFHFTGHFTGQTDSSVVRDQPFFVPSHHNPYQQKTTQMFFHDKITNINQHFGPD